MAGVSSPIAGQRRLHLAAIAGATAGLVVMAACGTADHPGTGGAPSAATGSATTGSAATTGSGGAGGCGGSTEVFGACGDDAGADSGTAAPGAACETAGDCRPACCPCAHGQTQYTYSACTCGKCASICDPVNDTRAPVCTGRGPGPGRLLELLPDPQRGAVERRPARPAGVLGRGERRLGCAERLRRRRLRERVLGGCHADERLRRVLRAVRRDGWLRERAQRLLHRVTRRPPARFTSMPSVAAA